MKGSSIFVKAIMIKTMIISLSAMLSNLAIGQDWFDSEWAYRRPVNIENTVGSDLSEYQVQLVLDGSFDFTKFNPDGGDILFTEEDGTTLIPFWIETWDPGTTNASIWLKAPNIPLAGSTVFMYYGNPNPVTTPPVPVEVPPIGPYLKDPGNPIIPIGDPGNGESLLAENIVYDDVTGHYWLLFAAYRGGQTLGLAWSDNPTDPAAWNWEGYVISDANAPHILKYGDTWYIFYADRGHGGPPYPIGVSSSPNVNGPYTYIGSVLEPTEAWESYRVDEPYVFQRNDGKWILMYMGDPGTTEEQIGYAVADDVLGPYTKFAGNPCIAFGPPGSFDAGTIADPWVYEYYGVYYIGYTVSPTIHSPWQTAMAYTSDWQTFTKNGILLPLGSEYNSFRGAVTRIGDTYVFPYTTKITSESTYQMAIATQSVYMTPPSPINNNIAVFDFIDDFDGPSLDPYKWYFARGDISQTNIQGGLLTLTGELDYVKILGSRSFGMDYLFEAKAYHPDQGTEGLIAEVGFSDIQWNVLRIVDDFPSITHWQRQAKLYGEPDELIDMQQLADTNWHIFRVYRNSPNTAGFQIDDNPIETTIGTPNTSVPTMELPPYLMSYGDGNEFNFDWIRVRKWAGYDINTSYGSEEFFNNGVDIRIFNESCGFFDIHLRPTVDITNSYISNIQFTLRWPANSVEFFNFSSDFDIAQQGPVYTDNGFNYAIFVSATPILVDWTADVEYTVMNFYHDQSGTGTGSIVIDTSNWSNIHNGEFYVEIMGFDRTGIIYSTLENFYLGLCGRLELKTILEGSYNSATEIMNPAFSSTALLPLSQPYNNEPWNYEGSETISWRHPHAIDWILVEFYSASNPELADTSTLIDCHASVIFDDGTIKSSSFSPYLSFNTSILDSLLVAIRHRNHLGIISTSEIPPITINNLHNYSYDFTTGAGQAYNNGQKHLGNGVYGMYGGDANSDGVVNISDLIQEWIDQSGTNGYFNGDMNLDTQINNQDKNDIWYKNMNIETQVPD